MNRIIAFYTKGTTVEIVLRIVLTLVLLYVVLKSSTTITSLFRNLFRDASNEVNVSNVLSTTQSADGTIEQNSFKATAKMIADGQFNAMDGVGTDESNLFDPLLDLTGAELRQVFEEFGSRDGRTLFQWYRDELCAGGLDACVFTSFIYHDGRVPGCESYGDQCHELEFMRAIWQKSGLPF